MKRRRTLSLLAAGMGVALALTGCGANGSNAPSASSGSGGSDVSGSSGGGAKIGVILPALGDAGRWEKFDGALMQENLTKAGLTPIVVNAQGDNQKFVQYADSLLSQGVKVLVVISPSNDIGATVQQKAAQQGVPVIDYDRLSAGGSADYYVSFDNERVGEMQGQALKDALTNKPGGQVIEIEGAPTDNNATLFHDGQQKVLKPLYDSGALKLVASQFIDNWDVEKGGNTFEQLLSANGGKVDGVMAAYDGFAGAIITVLQKNGLAGSVPVVGQDATAAALKDILKGNQYATIYKPFQQEADIASQLAVKLANGDTAGADALATGTVQDPKNNRTVKSVLIAPQIVTKENVKVVVDGGQVKASEICSGDTAAACTQLGISVS